MKKTVGVFSLIVMLLTQVLTPYAYAVGDLNPIAEETPVVESVDEPEAPVEEVGDDAAGSDDLSENPVIDELGEDLEDGAGLGESTSGEDGDASVVTEDDSAESGEVSEAAVESTDEGTDGEESKSTLDRVSDAVSNVVDAVVDVFKGDSEETTEEVDESIYASEAVYGTSSHKGVKVEVYAETGAFKETPDLDISVIESKRESEIKKVILEYNEDTEDLDEEEKEQVAEEKITEVVAFDIKFLDKETGEERQPREGKVRVSFNYNESETLEETEEHEIKVYHLDDKDEKGNTIEEIKDMEVDEPEVTENKEVEEDQAKTIEEENEEQQVVTVIGDKFSIYTIVQQVKEEGPLAENENQLANFVYGEISIEDPNNPGQGITIMDRNLGAIMTGAGSDANPKSYGYHYQWGNNYGFDPIIQSVDSGIYLIDASLYPNGYSGSQFVLSGGAWLTGSQESIENLWSGGNNQGPCPDGWHIPSIIEWNQLIGYYTGYRNANYGGSVDIEDDGTNLYIGNLDVINGFINKFKIPFAGLRVGSSYVVPGNTFGLYWSTSSVSSNIKEAGNFGLSMSSITVSPLKYPRYNALSLRCFKNTYNPHNEEDEFTITYKYNGGSGSTAANTVMSGEYAIEPEEPVKAGYIFDGWYESDTFQGDKFKFKKTVITANKTLYAKWISENAIARLKTGKEFNAIIKTLSETSAQQFDSWNTNIIAFEKSENAPINQDVVQISIDGSKTVDVWFDNGVIYYHTDADKIFLNSDSSYMFYKLQGITSVELSDFDTSMVNDMAYMFSNCNALENLDFSRFDTSHVINMSYMFNYFLHNLDLSSFDTSNVQNMSFMFAYYSGGNLDLRSFDTSRVINMQGMFWSYHGTTLNLDSFDTSSVVVMSQMFQYCDNLTELDLSNFRTSNIRQLGGMVAYCPLLQRLILDGWDFSNYVDNPGFYEVVSHNPVLRYISAKRWKTPEDFTRGFQNLFSFGGSNPLFETLDVSEWNLENTHKLDKLFYYTDFTNVVGIDTWKNTQNLTSVSNMFSTSKIKYLDMGAFNFGNVTSLNRLFDYTKLTGVDLSRIVIDNVNNFDNMFDSSYDLKTIYVGDNFDGVNLLDGNNMFNSTNSLVGGNGTKYNSDFKGISYAKIDGGESNPGYFTDPSHFAIRLKNKDDSVIATQWISTGGTAQALTGRYLGYDYYTKTGDNEYEPFSLTTPLYAYTEIYASGVDAYEVKFYSGDVLIDTSYVTGDDQSKVSKPEDLEDQDGYGFIGWYEKDEGEYVDEPFNFTKTAITGDIELYARWGSVSVLIGGYSISTKIGTLVSKTNVEVFTWSGSLPDSSINKQDISQSGLPVYIWYDSSAKTIYYHGEADVIFLNENSKDMFSNFSNLKSVDLSKMDFSKVKNSVYMFLYDSKLVSVDFGNSMWSNVEDMREMFEGCSSLTTIDLSGLVSTKIRDMSNMFRSCSELLSVDLSNFVDGNVLMMYSMFTGCKKLISVNLSSFVGHGVTDVHYMFENCENLVNVNLGSFVGDNVSDANGMFYNCKKLENLNLGNFVGTNLKYSYNMFYNCKSLQTLNLISFYPESLSTTYDMFQDMSELKTIYVGNEFVVGDAGSSMFLGDVSLVGGYGTNFDSTKTDKTYAKINTATQSGYFTDPNNFAVAYYTKEETPTLITLEGNKKIGDHPNGLTQSHTTYQYYTGKDETTAVTLNTIDLKAYTELYVNITCDSDDYGLIGTTCYLKHPITVEGLGSTINLTSSMEDNYLSGDEVTLSFLGDPDGKISWTSSPEISIVSSNSGHTISFIMPDEDLTLIPTIAAYHEVIFDVSENGLNFHPSEVVQNLVSGDIIDLSLYTGFRNGYEFVGWNTDKNAEEKIGDTYTMIDLDVTFYAIYRKALTGSFIGNGNKLEGNQDEIDRDCYMYNKKTSCEIVVPSIVENEHTKTILGYSESSNTGSAILVKSGVELNSGAIANGLLTISIGESFTGYAQTVAPAKTYTATYKIGTGDEVVLKILKESDSCTIGAVYNGNNDSDQSVDCTLISPVILTAEGYEGYWDGPMKGNIEFAMASDRTIYAWSTGMHYGITYYLGEDGYWGEGVVATGSYQEGDSFTLPVPSRDGYTFLGWTTNAETTPDLNKKIETTDSGAKFFVAHWRQDNYRISYIDLEPGTTNMVTGYNYNAAKSLNQPNKSRRGYVFTGWIGSNGDVPQKEVTIPQYSLGDKFYTAVWSPVVYNVTGYLNGGKIDNKDTYTFTYTVESDNITLAMPTRDNSTFVGWTGSNGSAADRNVTIANGSIGDREYYAVYTCNEGYEPSGNTCVLKPYNVTYELDGGKHTTTNVSGTVIKINDSYKITIKNPIKTGHVFKGWTANVSNITCKEGNTVRAMCRAESANDLTIEFTEGQDITLTATWEHLPIAVTLGSLKKVNNSYETDGTSVTTDYSYTDTIELLAEQKTGYETKGWSETTEGVIKYKDDVIKNVSDLTITYPTPSAAPDANAKGTATLYAVRDIITYTIVYKLGGGSHSNPMTYKVTDANITLTDPVKTGYDFKGWYDDEENKITVINQDVISGLTSPYKLILTAEWEASKNTPYKVYHERQGIDGNYHKDDLTQTEVEDLSGETNTTITPARKSYIGFITPIDQKSAKVEADGFTEVEYFYTRAQYDYTLTDVLGAATVGTTATNHDMYYETPITLKGDAETGYTWSGWIIESGDQTTFNPNKEISFTMPLNDVTVTPVVIHNKWRLSFDANEGTGDVESLAEKYPVYYNDIIDFPVVTKTGYTFAGWYSGDVRYDLPVKNMPDSDLVLIAHWSAEPFVLKVNHYKMNLSGEYPETPTKIVSINTEIDADLTGTIEARILPETYTGFTLSGDAVESIHINSDGSSVINYYYIRDKHNVSITENDGVMLSGTLSGEYYYGTTINVEAEAKTGYTWSGWNVTSGGETSFTELTGLNFILSTGDIELTPLTTTNSYHLTIRDGDTIYFSGDVEYLSVITLPATPSKNGYSFNGWANYPNNGKMVAHDLEITASWASSYRPTGGPGGNSSSSSSSSDNKKVFVNTGTQEQEHGTAELTGTNKPLNETGVDDKQVKKDDIKPIEDMGFEEVKSVSADQLNMVNKSSFTKEQIEILDAYQWAYEHNITTMVTLRDANPEGVVTRGHLAKMVVNYAINVLGQQLPEKTPVECRWNDWRTDWESQEIKDYAVKACALGLMGLDMGKFQPKVWVSRAQFGTIMSRLLWGKKYAGGKPYYRNHLKALKESGIMTQIGNPEGRTEIRQWVRLMLMRAAKDQNKG